METFSSFNAYIQKAIVENWDQDALTDYQGITLQFHDVARKIEKIHILFENSDVKKGDKIAICGRNSAHWAVAFLATLTYGAVAVPILHEFNGEQIQNIVNHSGSKLLFVGDYAVKTIDPEAMPGLEAIINLPDFSLLISRSEKVTYAREHLNMLFGSKYPRAFRAEHINLPDYTAIVFSSRHAIDAYFKLCEEMRFKVPETMKYFCSTEAVAMYLQKHIVYRKRKIFYGTGTPASIVALVTAKHKGEKFLITASEGSNTTPITTLFSAAGLDYTVGILVKAVSQDLKDVDLSSYGLAVLCNPADVVSLHDNFPGFAQGDLKFISFGKAVVKALEGAGYEIALQAPTPEATSISKAVELYLQSLQ